MRTESGLWTASKEAEILTAWRWKINAGSREPKLSHGFIWPYLTLDLNNQIAYAPSLRPHDSFGQGLEWRQSKPFFYRVENRL